MIKKTIYFLAISILVCSCGTKKAQTNTTDIVETKIENEIKDQELDIPIVGGVSYFKYTFKDASVRFPANYSIEVNNEKVTTYVDYYTEVSIEKYEKSKTISTKDWNDLVSLSSNAQEGLNYPAPGGHTGYSSHTLVRKNAGTLEAYTLSWTSLSKDKIDKNTEAVLEKIKSLAYSRDEVLKSK
jgi:hypothetical protein